MEPVELGLRDNVRPQGHPRRSPLRPAVEEVEEIQRGVVNDAPQVFRTVVHRGDEFDMLEDDVASVEIKA